MTLVVIIVSPVVVHEHSVVYWLKAHVHCISFCMYMCIFLHCCRHGVGPPSTRKWGTSPSRHGWCCDQWRYTLYILLTSTCIIVWLENVHVYPHRVWVCSKGTLSVIGASLSQPHTSVTSLRTRVCMFACLLACFFSCILCLSCYLFRPWVSLPTNPYPMLVAFQDPEIQLALNRLSPKPRPQTYSAQN